MSVAEPLLMPSSSTSGAPLAAAIPKRVRLRVKQAVLTIPAVLARVASAVEPLPLPSQPRELLRVRRQLYHHLRCFRHRQWLRDVKAGNMTKMKARYHTQDACKYSVATRKKLVKAWQDEGLPEAMLMKTSS